MPVYSELHIQETSTVPGFERHFVAIIAATAIGNVAKQMKRRLLVYIALSSFLVMTV